MSAKPRYDFDDEPAPIGAPDPEIDFMAPEVAGYAEGLMVQNREWVRAAPPAKRFGKVIRRREQEAEEALVRAAAEVAVADIEDPRERDRAYDRLEWEGVRYLGYRAWVTS
jgi:hypothetical protein